MRIIAGVVSAMIAVTGFYYLLVTTAATSLAGVESRAVNRKRRLLRQSGGLAMLPLSAGVFCGMVMIDADRHPQAFVLDWSAVFVLLLVVVILALVDLLWTRRLRKVAEQAIAKIKPGDIA